MVATRRGPQPRTARQRVVFALGIMFIGGTTVALCATAPEPTGAGDHPIILDGLTYMGNASCAGSDCHSAEEATEQTGQLIGDESNVWEGWDPHGPLPWSREGSTFATLDTDASKAIADKLGIAHAAESSDCLSCHAMDVPEAQHGDNFEVAVGVGCESCHGPAQKWLDPHKNAGWTAGERKSKNAMALRGDLGLIDTSHLATRAERCVTCHLRIEQPLIDAGHPRLEFELTAYSNYLYPWSEDYAPHWDDTRLGPMTSARMWAVGQVISRKRADESAAESDDAKGLAALYGKGVEIATAHFGAADAPGLTSANITPDQCLAAATDLVAAAPMARNRMECNIVGFGVAALTEAAIKGSGGEPSESFEALVKAPIARAAELTDPAADKAAFIEALQALLMAAREQAATAPGTAHVEP